jgi:hypothetical protein
MTGEERCGDVMVGLVGGGYVAKGEGEGREDVAVSSKGEKGGGCYSVERWGNEPKWGYVGKVEEGGYRGEGLGTYA